MKKIICVLVLIMLTCTLFSASGEGEMVMINDRTNANVRSKPSVEADIVGIAMKESAYELLDISDNNWYKIRLDDGTIGWVSGSLGVIVERTPQNIGPAYFTYSNQFGEETTLEWCISPQNVSANIVTNLYEGNMLYWGIPFEKTEEKSGYYATCINNTLTYAGFPINDLRLYFAYQYETDGYVRDPESAHLYMVEFNLYLNSDKGKLNSLLSYVKNEFGQPKTIDTTTTNVTMINFQTFKSTTYHRNYVWTCPDSTGIRIQGSSTSQNNAYETVKVCIGKTDLDASMREGKLSNKPSYMQAVVKSDSITLNDSNGYRKRSISYGTVITVMEYNPSLDAFRVEFTETDAGMRTSGGTLYIGAFSIDEEGYISGKGLNYSREELLRHFQ